MTFEEWADGYALDDEPLTITDRRLDCLAAWNAAIQAEREACAKVCDEGAAALNVMGERDGAKGAMSCAGAIRMRSNASNERPASAGPLD